MTKDITQERTDKLNVILDGINKAAPHDPNNKIIRHLGIREAEYYAGVKKLIVLKRLNKKDKRKVISKEPVTPAEYEKACKAVTRANGKKKGSRKPVKKRVKKEKPQPMLDAPVFLPPGEGRTKQSTWSEGKEVTQTAYTHENGAEVSISGTADGIIHFLRLIKDGVLG